MRKNVKCAQLRAKPYGITVETAAQQDFLFLRIFYN